jgi:hypothetical protein
MYWSISKNRQTKKGQDRKRGVKIIIIRNRGKCKWLRVKLNDLSSRLNRSRIYLIIRFFKDDCLLKIEEKSRGRWR